MKVERKILDKVNEVYKKDYRYLLGAEVEYDSAQGKFDSELIASKENLSDELQMCTRLLGKAAFYTWLTDGRFHEPVSHEKAIEMLFENPFYMNFGTTHVGGLTTFAVSQHEGITGGEYFRVMHKIDVPFDGEIRLAAKKKDNGLYRILFDCSFRQLKADGKLEVTYKLE